MFVVLDQTDQASIHAKRVRNHEAELFDKMLELSELLAIQTEIPDVLTDQAVKEVRKSIEVLKARLRTIVPGWGQEPEEDVSTDAPEDEPEGMTEKHVNGNKPKAKLARQSPK